MLGIGEKGSHQFTGINSQVKKKNSLSFYGEALVYEKLFGVNSMKEDCRCNNGNSDKPFYHC